MNLIAWAGRLRRALVRLYWDWRRGTAPRLGTCPHCGRWGCLLVYTIPMTMYPDRDDGTDPNHVGHLCRDCKAEYCEYWQERWDEYNSGRL